MVKMTSKDNNNLVLVKGGGDIGTGVAWRLFRAGFPVVVTELPDPLVIRRAVAFAAAMHKGHHTVEGVVARRVASVEAAGLALRAGEIPVLADPEASCRHRLKPRVLVDATIAKRNTGTHVDDAPLVVALGPGFTAGVDCHAVVETCRGHTLGRVYWEGAACADTGTPGRILGYDAERVLHAPCDGVLHACRDIGDMVQPGDVIATVSDTALVATFPGVLRGLLHEGCRVCKGLKVGDVDPRAVREHCFTISDKALAMGGAVLCAIMTWRYRRGGRPVV